MKVRETNRRARVDEYFRMKLQWKSMSEEQQNKWVSLNSVDGADFVIMFWTILINKANFQGSLGSERGKLRLRRTLEGLIGAYHCKNAPCKRVRCLINLLNQMAGATPSLRVRTTPMLPSSKKFSWLMSCTTLTWAMFRSLIFNTHFFHTLSLR